MATVLLDTAVASFLHPKRKGSPNVRRTRRISWEILLPSAFKAWRSCSNGPKSNHWGAVQRAALGRFLSRFLIVPYDMEPAKAWARVMAHTRAIGRRLEAGDGWIAATAVHHKLVLITHDADFERLGLPDLNVIRHTP